MDAAAAEEEMKAREEEMLEELTQDLAEFRRRCIYASIFVSEYRYNVCMCVYVDR